MISCVKLQKGDVYVGPDWLNNVLYGFLSGFYEFLPVSAETHRMLFLHLTGVTQEIPLIRLCVRLAALLGVFLAMYPVIMRIRRENQLASIPPRRRRRQPDKRYVLLLRMVKTCTIPSLLMLLLYQKGMELSSILWLHGALLVLNGLVLYIPQFMLRGNKDAQNMSAWDSWLIGIAAGLSVLPGFSRVGCAASVAQMRGADRSFSVEAALLISVPVLIALCLFDFFAVVTVSATVSFTQCLLVFLAALVGSYVGTRFLRYFAGKAGLVGFAYYSWGMALFCLILYLTVI